MTQDSNAVLIGKGRASGAVFLNRTAGAVLPTDASTALVTGFECPGLVSEEGLAITINRETKDIKGWHGSGVRTITTSFETTYKLKFIQTSASVLQAIFGPQAVSVVGELVTLRLNSTTAPAGAWVFEMYDPGFAAIRATIPSGTPVTSGDIVFGIEDPISFEVEIKCAADNAGNLSYLYVENLTGVEPEE